MYFFSTVESTKSISIILDRSVVSKSTVTTIQFELKNERFDTPYSLELTITYVALPKITQLKPAAKSTADPGNDQDPKGDPSQSQAAS